MIYEQDPLMDNYLALYVCIVWYRPIASEEAFRLIEGRSNMKKMCRIITPELETKVRKICSSPSFKNMDRLSKRFGISEGDIKRIISSK